MHNNNQQGSALALILVGVVLFAALIFVTTRGMDTGTTKMTSAQARTQAADIINYAQVMERAVARMLQNGISETDLSFENAVVSGYDHTPAASDAEKIFASSAGGGLSWRSPAPDQTPATTNAWLFTGGVVVTGQESNSLSELLATLPVSVDVCTEINRQLNVTTDITVDQGTVTGAKFTGTYANNAGIVIAPGTGISGGCIRGLVTNGTQTGSYTFFKVLIAR
jgi:hypothetical protein